MPYQWWKSQGTRIRDLTKSLGDVHFSGHSSPLVPWQNACFVVELESVDDLRSKLRKLAGKYGQDSIALTIGETEFVEP